MLDGWLNGFTADPVGKAALHLLFPAALAQFQTFALVLLRLSGLVLVGPLLGLSTIPTNIRALMVIFLALLVTPTLTHQAQRGFEQLDADGDGRWARHEVPAGLLPRYEALQQARHLSPDQSLLLRDYTLRARWPETLAGLVQTALGEVGLGLVLGLGVTIVLSGLQLAGQLIDQQSGFGLGEVFNPDLQTSGSVSGQMLYLLGTAVFVMAAPIGGHLQLIRILTETFQTLPPGEAFISFSALELLQSLVQQSLVIGIRVAAPVIVLMSLIDLTLGFLSHSVPQINVQTVGFSLRAMLSFLFLAATLTNFSESIWNFFLDALDMLQETLVFPNE